MSHSPLPTFPEVLQDLLVTLEARMPRALWEEAWDHCYRHDGLGLTLCFGSPLREDLLTRLLPWLDAETPDTARRLRATLPLAPEVWPGPIHRGEVNLWPWRAPVATAPDAPRQETLL